MKNLMMLFLLALISVTSVNAQTTDNKKATINSTDRQIEKTTHDGIDYYIIDGIWYSKFKKRYVLKQAPKGAIINFTPKDGKMVIMGGKKYYKCKGVFYKKTKDSLYEVTSP